MIASLKIWFESLRTIITSLRALLLFVLLYALLLVSFYFFISTREATVLQVLATYGLLLLLPMEFFTLQASILEFAHRHKFNLKQVITVALKLIAVTIPILILGAFCWWLMNKLQARFPAPVAPVVFAPTPPKPQPIHWATILIATFRFVLFGIAFPLATLHLWIEAAVCDVRASFAGGLKTIFGRIGGALARAFSSEAVFVYGLGLILFVLGPYLILAPRIPLKGTKTAFIVFILQLIVAFGLMLIGWVVTLVALTRVTADSTPLEIKAPATVAASPA